MRSGDIVTPSNTELNNFFFAISKGCPCMAGVELVGVVMLYSHTGSSLGQP